MLTLKRDWLRVVEVKSMSLSVFLGVKVCSKVFGAILKLVFAWEKTMFARRVFLVVVSPDCAHYSLGNVEGVESLDLTG